MFVCRFGVKVSDDFAIVKWDVGIEKGEGIAHVNFMVGWMSLRKEVNVLRSWIYGLIPKPVSTGVENAPHPFLSRKFKKK